MMLLVLPLIFNYSNWLEDELLLSDKFETVEFKGSFFSTCTFCKMLQLVNLMEY